MIRRIEFELDVPTTDGAVVIRLLTNLPAKIQAKKIANLYRRRWSIEGMFGKLEAALNSEIRTLGHPRAALLAFGCATLKLIAKHVDPRALRKSPRGPKLKKPKGYASSAAVHKHVATARILRDGRIK